MHKLNELGVRIIVRLVELHRENEFLKKEARQRRRQADTWRKKFRKLSKKKAV